MKLNINIPTETKGGFPITKFKMMAQPEKIVSKDTLIYSGMVDLPNVKGIEIRWDENGKCANTDRPDCFIEIVKK